MKTSSQSEKRKNLEWSLKPIFVCMQICGIPAFEPNSSTHWFLKLAIYQSPVLICLILNSFFSIYTISFEIKRGLCPTGNQYAMTIFKQLEYPTLFFNFFSMISNPAFVLGIPLIFVLQFHFTGKWRDILKSFNKIDQEIVLDENFYRRCRIRCLFSILSFLAVSENIRNLLASWYLSMSLFYSLPINIVITYQILTGFVYPRSGSLTSIFNVGKFFDLKLKSVVCQKMNVLILQNLTTMPPMYDYLSLGIGIWVTSSAFVVLTLFCALVWMASLLADELNKRMEEIRFTARNDKEINYNAYFLAVDKCLKEFDLLNSLVESINNFFGHIMIIALFYIMIAFIVGINVLILLYVQAGKLTFQVLCTLIPLLIGLGITTILCWHLQYKVSY